MSSKFSCYKILYSIFRKDKNLNLIFYNAEITPEFKILEGQISKFISYYYYKGQPSSGVGAGISVF